MDQAITGFHKDDDWVAELACGRFQHTRHNPPWTNRPWVTSEAGRNNMLAHKLPCKNVMKVRKKINYKT